MRLASPLSGPEGLPLRPPSKLSGVVDDRVAALDRTPSFVEGIMVSGDDVVKCNWKLVSVSKASDGGYIIRKNGWSDVKTVRSWQELLFQFHKWSEFKDKAGKPMFSEGYPPRKDIEDSFEPEPEVLDEPTNDLDYNTVEWLTNFINEFENN